MTSRKDLKTTGRSGSARRSSSTEPQARGGGLRKFFQRLCIYGLTLIGMLLIYFVMGGDSKKLIGVKNPDEIPANQSDGVTHSVGKPAMDEYGNPIRKVSGDSDMFGSDFDEILATGAEPEYSSGSETSPEAGYGSPSGTSGADSSPSYDSGSSGGETPMTGTSGSESGTSSGETPASSSDYSNGYGSDSSGSYGSDSSSGYGSGSSGSYGSDSSSSYGSGSSGSYGSDSSSGYGSGSSGSYGSDSSSGYGSNYSGSASSGFEGGLASSTDTSGAKGNSLEGTLDIPPETPPIRNYKEGVVTGPDGLPRRDEVTILEVGRGEPVRNHFGPAVTDFLDLFDFSITPDWIEANWSSAAIVGPLTTRGYRVPISTGPEPSDLVGSLTYYFNNRLELEKITFEGYTGDLDRLLISLKYFNLTKRITSDPSALLYLSEPLSDNRRSFLKSYFRLQSHDKAEPNKRYWLTLELYPPEK